MSSVFPKNLRLLGLATLVLGVGAVVLWRVRAPAFQVSDRKPQVSSFATGIVETPIDSHRPDSSYSKTGDARPLPANPTLSEALSHTSRLDYALRLKAVHAMGRELTSRPLTPDQVDFLRTFVAAPAIPEGLTIEQLRALKNDVLNVLCLVPGEEPATGAMLRALHADETADPGLRDYALQHLVTLAERDPTIGWDTHWTALNGDNPALAATALLHLAIQLRSQASSNTQVSSFSPQVSSASFQVSGLKSQVSSASSQVSGFKFQVSSAERQRIESAAIRLASDPAVPEPARTTGLQVCGRLKLTEARALANDLARSDRVGFPLRIAAVATLGDLGGDAETRAYLTSLTTAPERRLRVPAESALKRFSIN